MHRRIAIVALLCALALGAGSSPIGAAGPQFWRLEGARAFLDGELHGLSVDALGRLRLGPELHLLYDPGAPNAWSLTRDAKGTLYVGTGNDGRVMKVESGRGSLLFDADETEVHALAIGPDGRVYAGTSPEGAVYAIDASGKATRFFDPEEKYIWALAFDAAGNLYVATGGEGRVYKVGRDGRGTTVITTADTHVLSLAFDAKGRLFAGTAPQGLVYRLDTQGKVFVALDSPFREIRALEAADDGSVYAAAIDRQTTEPTTTRTTPAGAPASAAPVAEVTVSESFTVTPAGGGQPIAVTPAAEAVGGVKGAVLRLRENGDVDTVWSSTEDIPHSLVRSGDGILVGTGDAGKIYRVAKDGEWSLVATVPGEQVTGLSRGSGTQTFVVTSNPGRVYTLDPSLGPRGTFLSKVKDAETSSAWGQVSWEGSVPPGTSVEVETRSGNTEKPDSTWTDWSAPLTRARGEGIRSERARFLQLRVTLAGKSGATPTLESLAAAYLQRNLPPQIKSITVLPAGEVFQKPIAVSGDPEILGLETDPVGDRAAAGRLSGMPPAISFSRKMYQRGLRTVSWQAEDPNGDALLYEVQYRAVGDERWRPLRRGLSEPVFAWDTSAVPNGRYLLRIIASDAPANPPAFARTGSKDSASFEVDNSPPTLTASLDPSKPARVRASARDDSPLRKLEASIDAGPWEEILPTDGVSDSREEEYEIQLPPSTGGVRVLVLRVSDILGNVATIRVDVP